MAAGEVVEILKSCANSITTSKTKERHRLCSEVLVPCISREGFSEAHVRAVFKIVFLTQHRYRDNRSRKDVENVVEQLAKRHGTISVKYFCASFSEIEAVVKFAQSKVNCGSNLVLLRWSCILVQSVYLKTELCKGDEWLKLVQAKCYMVHSIFSEGTRCICDAARKKLFKVWREVPGIAAKYGEAICKLESSQFLLCMAGLLFNFCAKNKDTETINKLKKPFLDMYIKTVLIVKMRPPTHVLVQSRSILCHATHEEFNTLLLPALQKAILRNPELVLESAAHLVSGVSIDLSKYATAICKNVAAQLRAKEEMHRQEAALVLKNLAYQCSDPWAIEELLEFLFAILNGSEGKLTQWTDRHGVVAGIGNLESSSVSGNSALQGLSQLVAGKMAPYLQQEVHEGTLVHGLAVLGRWCCHLTNEVPTTLIEAFKKGMTHKNSTAVVRHGYLQCMANAFQGNTLLQGIVIVPELLQSVDRASSQSHQTPIVSEGLTAAFLLIRLALADVEADAKLNSFWPILLDAKKQLFVSEKFLSSASEDALHQLISVIEKLFLSHEERITKANTQPWHRALVYLLVHSSWKIRQSCQSTLQRLFKSFPDGGLELQSALLVEFGQVLIQQQPPKEESPSHLVNGKAEPVSSVTPLDMKQIPPKILVRALHFIMVRPLQSNLDLPPERVEEIALSFLQDSHHPIIVSRQNHFWIDNVRSLDIDVCSLLQKHEDKLLDIILSGKVNSESILCTVSHVAPSVLSSVMPQLIACLEKVEFQQVTVDEYSVMVTPEGELYDKSVVQRAKGLEEAKKHNVKKESKAYSFEDQKWEEELRGDLKRKKQQQGKLGIKDEMSQKEKEVFDTQMAKEAEIRQRLQKLHKELLQTASLLKKVVMSNPTAMSSYTPTLLPTLLSLLQSPLAAPVIMPVFLALRSCVFEEEHRNLATLVAYVTLRLLQPKCQIALNWCEEQLPQATLRTVSLLHALTVPSTKSEGKPLSAPAFAYCFPLLRCVLHAGGKAVGGGDELRLKALQVIAEHCKLRSDAEDLEDDEDEAGPALLPRREMFSLLAEVISTSSDTITGSRLQQLASLSTVELCKASNGDEGCTLAEAEEIDVLLNSLESSSSSLRFAALQGFLSMTLVLPGMDEGSDQSERVARRLWVGRFDVNEENAKLGENLWDLAGYTVTESVCHALLDDVIHDVTMISEAAAPALSGAVGQNQDLSAVILQQLIDMYEIKLKVPPPVIDSLGRVVSDAVLDPYPARCGIALALGKLSPYLSEDEVSTLFTFFVPTGLGDHDKEVRKHMLDAALTVVNEHGKANITTLLPVFESFLDLAPDTSAQDTIRQSVIILMGSLARHLDKEDPKVRPIVTKLIDALSTPSQQVQEAVAKCLPPLVPAIKSEAPDMVKKLLDQLLESTMYGERKGAAYGLAGLVKGLGILSLKQLKIMSTLQEAIQDKKNFRHREGALFAFEMLCMMLGRLFEPYVVHVLPHLLLCFGDGNQYVREATDDTARAVMKNLSAHGVKLVLPSLLVALEEDSWRTKTGSVELLGAMAYCAPKQLSSCLPSIVPRLSEVLTDSHIKVQKAGAQALKQIGSVIRNPEILAISSVLLEALMDPSSKTAPCLHVLLQTSFVHFIDAPSLALIMPVLHRALSERSTETKKMASQIIGSMYSLTDRKDLSPYLPSVVPGLKQALLDPVPEVRTVSARALGALVRGMGEDGSEDLLPWLMETLTSENSSVDRSGAAQGLSEVLCSLGKERLEALMPEVISTTSRLDLAPHVREGYLMLYIYLPSTFKDDFVSHVGAIIPSILKGLADESEFVRDTSLKAGQRIVSMYADTAIELFLPQLESGLFDDNWRIRQSSVQLLGDLLYKISGVTGKMTTEGAEDDNFGTSHSNQAITACLGMERRNRVLAGLYMGRSDVSLMVRQAALHVWKVVVPNTPRILREILSTLFSLLLGCLASTSFDKRQVAARTLGDLVRKLGERVLPEIIPILERGLDSGKSDERQGVCIGLTEIISSTSKEQVVQYVDSLVPTVRRALIDPLPEVRAAAATTFDNLHSTIGGKALDDILPDLLKKMEDPSVSEFALDGLRQVMAVKSRVVLPFLVPQLIKPPVNTRALAILSAVAGDALTRHLSKILPALLTAIQDSMGTEREQEELEGAQNLVLSVQEDAGVRTVMDELLDAAKHQNSGMRRAAVSLLRTFCSQTRVDYSEYLPTLFRGIICAMNDRDEVVVSTSWDALSAVTKRLEPTEQLQHVGNVRQAIKFVADDVNENLPGFCLPKKGITPLLPIFREGILNGTPDLKEQAANGLGEVISLTSAAALRPSVINITGPLIRILGDRFSWNVKVAVLKTLGLLLQKVGVMLKPFLPQLQTTFIKALNDANKAVRLSAASALQQLIALHTRVDPLFTELHNGIKNTDDVTIRETLLQALRGVLAGAGQKMGEPVRNALTDTLLRLLGNSEDGLRVAAGGCIGSLALVVPDAELETIVNEQITVSDPTVDWTMRHGCAIAVSAVLHDAPDRLISCGLYDALSVAAISHATTDRIPICSFGVRSLAFIISNSVKQEESPSDQAVETLLKVLQTGSNDVKILAAVAVQYVCKVSAGPLNNTLLKRLIPALLTATKERNTGVRAAAESALVSVIRLRQGEDTLQTCCRLLDAGTAEALNDLCRKSLRRLATQEDNSTREMEAPFTMELG